MKINFMKPVGGQKPTKTFKLYDDVWDKKNDYPLMKHFTGISQECDDLEDLSKILKAVLNKPVFMIHGDFIEGVDLSKMLRRSREGRQGEPPTIKDKNLEWFCIDVDKYSFEESDEYPNHGGLEMIRKFIKEELPDEFSKVNFVYQFSSSAGLTKEKKLKAHIFFRLKHTIHNTVMMKWAKDWKPNGTEYLDPSVYKSAQPIYTMKRICLDDNNFLGSSDPIDDDEFVGFYDVGNEFLNWYPNIDYKSGPLNKSAGNLTRLDLDQPVQETYSMSDSIRKIMSSENFHDQIRSTALSLVNKGLPKNDVKALIEEFMLVAKKDIENDEDRLNDWQNRFDDIPRAVESAVDIVGKPSFEEVVDWIDTSNIIEVTSGFAKRLVGFHGVELKQLVRAIEQKTGFGTRAISEDVKLAKMEKEDELADLARKKKTEERKAQDIYEVEISNSGYGAATEQICKIMAESKKKPEVYRLGNTISVVEYSTPKTIRQITKKGQMMNDYPEMPVIHDISHPVGVIRSRAEKDCVFLSEKGSEIVCPDSILNAIPRMYGAKWKPLSGIVEHPFIDDTWKPVEKSGYDPNTGLYAVLHKKLKITLTDPKEAYDYLANNVLAEFPFQTDLDRAAAVGMFMTAIQRPYVIGDNGMPGFAIVSPKPSSGKTTLAQLLSYSMYNRPVAATGWSDNDEELGKHLLAILREGHSCVLFDNIKKDAAIQSNELAKAMTSGTYSRRKLGSNETEEVPSGVLWLFTGNNIVFKGDFATRILPIRIVPSMERPEFRKFNRTDIGQWAMENRKRIISAVLSIVTAGKNIDYDKYDSSARFKEWNKFVRIPLLEVSGHDLLDVFDRNDFLDDEAIAKGELLEMLHNTFGNNPFKTKDIMKLIEGHNLGLKTIGVDSSGDDFRHAITDAFNEKAVQNIKTLGRFILGMKDFILRGYKLIREEGYSVAQWRVIRVDE